MKSSRSILIATFVILGIFCSVLFSCTKNTCGSTSCQNGGTCLSNVCSCPTGFYGTSCEKGWSDVMVGTYKCSRSNCNPAVLGVNSWTSTIGKDAINGGYRIDISNFDNNNFTVVATIDTNHHITVSTATGASGINATGNFVDGEINLSFTTSSVAGVGGYRCDMKMIKQP